MTPTSPILRIAAVAALLGIEPHVLRYWEDEFRFYLRIERSKRGQRVYTAEQVERLREVHRLLKVELYTHEGAKRQLRGRFEPRPAATVVDVYRETRGGVDLQLLESLGLGEKKEAV